MLSKKHRLNKELTELIFKKGGFIGAGNITLKFLLNNNSTPPKVSFITPKSVSKLAVKRNLLRRRGYTVLSKHIENLPKGFIGAFVFGKKSLNLFGYKAKKGEKIEVNRNLENEIQTIFNKMH